jgi:hypothetical protein
MSDASCLATIALRAPSGGETFRANTAHCGDIGLLAPVGQSENHSDKHRIALGHLIKI